VVMGCGQFCTNPGLVVQVPEYLSNGDRIRIHVAERRYMGRAD